MLLKHKYEVWVVGQTSKSKNTGSLPNLTTTYFTDMGRCVDGLTLTWPSPSNTSRLVSGAGV